MMKIGIDIHGVLDTNPEYWVSLVKSLKEKGWEIHVISGKCWGNDIEKELLDYDNGIKWWDYYFSIDDYLFRKGSKFYIDDKGGRRYDEEEWDKSKAEYCADKGITLHIDDSDVYWKYFKTPYAKVKAKE